MNKDLFGEKPRRKRRVMMHVIDAGQNTYKVIMFECSKCGYNTDWIRDERTISENKRGMPCPKYNEKVSHENNPKRH